MTPNTASTADPVFRRLSQVTWRGLCVAVAMLGAGCATPSPPQSLALRPATRPIATPQAAAPRPAFQDSLQQLAIRYGICNVTAAVIRQREVETVVAAQGCAAETMLTPDSVFEAASLSKPVFAYAVLKLAQQGRLNLDAPVLNYLPQGYAHPSQPHLPDSPSDRVSDPRLQAITARMVLNHTAGLPNWSGGPLFFVGQPGEKWSYSGEGYLLLQRAVEAITRQSLDDFMAQQVFHPMGMTRSAYTSQPALEKQLVAGSTRDGTRLGARPFRAPVAAYTLYTSARDYGLFLATLLKDQPLLQQIIERPVPVDPKLKLAWGLGWGLEQDPGESFIWHWGNNPGYRAFVMASPRSGDGFVLFTNSDGGLALAEPFGDQVLPGPHAVYRFHMLRDGLAGLLCEILGVCP
jgi:CubicO group peptidase (beta-lactamase class C family)